MGRRSTPPIHEDFSSAKSTARRYPVFPVLRTMTSLAFSASTSCGPTRADEVTECGHGRREWPTSAAGIGLDGVLDQQANYERSGFRFAHQHIRHQGIGCGAIPADVVPAAEVPFELIAGYDRACFPAARAEFLRRWIALPNSVALAVVVDGTVTGYGVIRPSANGRKIGPLFADDVATARRLLQAFWASAPGAPICIDIPDSTFNALAAEILRPLETQELFRAARMCTREPPPVAAKKIFGITTMELG